MSIREKFESRRVERDKAEAEQTRLQTETEQKCVQLRAHFDAQRHDLDGLGIVMNQEGRRFRLRLDRRMCVFDVEPTGFVSWIGVSHKKLPIVNEEPDSRTTLADLDEVDDYVVNFIDRHPLGAAD